MSIQILQELRNLNVLIVHPNDREGTELCKQIERIGCNVTMEWPFPKYITSLTDVIFVTTLPDRPLLEKPLLLENGTERPTVIAIVEYENPTVLQMAYEVGVHAIISTPIKPFGLLANLVVARMHWHNERELNSNIAKLEYKISNLHCVEKAIAILERTNEIDHEKAYEYIRRQAMNRRISTEDIAQEIIRADKMLDINRDKLDI